MCQIMKYRLIENLESHVSGEEGRDLMTSGLELM